MKYIKLAIGTITLSSCMQDYSSPAVSNRRDRNPTSYKQVNNHNLSRQDELNEARTDREVKANQRRAGFMDPIKDAGETLQDVRGILQMFR